MPSTNKHGLGVWSIVLCALLLLATMVVSQSNRSQTIEADTVDSRFRISWPTENAPGYQHPFRIDSQTGTTWYLQPDNEGELFWKLVKESEPSRREGPARDAGGLFD